MLHKHSSTTVFAEDLRSNFFAKIFFADFQKLSDFTSSIAFTTCKNQTFANCENNIFDSYLCHNTSITFVEVVIIKLTENRENKKKNITRNIYHYIILSESGKISLF